MASLGGAGESFLLDEAVNTAPENLRVMMDVNLGAALWLSQAVEPYMRQRGSGAIVHVSLALGPIRPRAWRTASARRPSATSSGSSTLSCAGPVSG